MKSTFAAVVLAGFTLGLGGCAMEALPPPSATIENIQAVRAGNLAPMNVGAFTPGPGHPTEMDKSVSVRAGIQNAPGGSYAKYLGETLAAQLKATGKLDPASTLVVSGVVTDTHLDSSMTKPHALLAAKITLTKAGAVVFDKTLTVESTWDGHYMGAVAIPDAFNHYTGLFGAMATKLFSDPEFQAAAH